MLPVVQVAHVEAARKLGAGRAVERPATQGGGSRQTETGSGDWSSPGNQGPSAREQSSAAEQALASLPSSYHMPQTSSCFPLPARRPGPARPPPHPPSAHSLPLAPLMVQPQLHVDRHQRHQQLQGGLQVAQRAQGHRVPRPPAVGAARRAPQVERDRVPGPPAAPQNEDDAGVHMACGMVQGGGGEGAAAG